jgi:multiple antibiotic resistance protein
MPPVQNSPRHKRGYASTRSICPVIAGLILLQASAVSGAQAGGIVLFLVALQGILQQFTPPAPSAGEAAPATLRMAITPIAFPTIVTPYGIAALIVFVALSPDWHGRLVIGGILLGIMLLNVAAMLLARHILRFLGVFLQILGAVLGIIQVALGLQIILNSLRRLWV